jgi:hypothetical protein
MGTLSSRKGNEINDGDTVVAPNLEDLGGHAGPMIKITVDRVIDPPTLSIVQEAVWPYPEELLLYKSLDAGFTLQDLVVVLDALGHPIEYEEKA